MSTTSSLNYGPSSDPASDKTLSVEGTRETVKPSEKKTRAVDNLSAGNKSMIIIFVIIFTFGIAALILWLILKPEPIPPAPISSDPNCSCAPKDEPDEPGNPNCPQD